MAVRPLLPALLLSLSALLAGCADAFQGTTLAIKQESELAAASGLDGETGECDGDATLAYTMTRRAGALRIMVSDDDGAILYDSGELTAAPEGFEGRTVPDVEGPAGVWSLSVERLGYTGTYTVTVAC